MKRKTWISVAVLLGLLALLAAGCNSSSVGANARRDTKTTELFSQRLENAVPYPLAEMKDSQERRNLRERLLRFNRPDKIGYVYLLGMNGNYVGYYTITGKVSSTDSQMTNTEQFAKPCKGCSIYTMNSMGDDGSYGSNELGVFFFTTNGVLVETSMEYVYSDSPLPVDAPKLNPKKGVEDLSKRIK